MATGAKWWRCAPPSWRFAGLLLFVFLGVSSVRESTAQERVPVAAIFPPVIEGVTGQQHVALLMQAHAVEYLVAMDRYSDLHIKQILRMAERDGRSPEALAERNEAWQIGARLGAERLVYGKLIYEGETWRLEVKAASLDPQKPRENIAPPKRLPRMLRDAIAEGGRYMAEQVAQLDGIKLPDQLIGGVTYTRNAEALAAYGRCYAGLINQSFRIDSPVMLKQEELTAVENQCAQAAAKDPGWKTAEAAKLLVMALRASQDPQKNQPLSAEVAKQLDAWDGEQGYQPFYFLAAYWLATVFVSADNGMVVLDEALKHHPHSLIFHSYRGRHLLWSGQYEQAEAAWRKYLALNPSSAYVRGGLSHALSLREKRAEAIREAKLAYDRDHGDREALVELASRYIDDAKYQDAIDLLAPASQSGTGNQKGPAARGDLFLRLGYAYMKKQPPSLAEAERALQKSIAVAKSPSEWKLRARAHLDLAELYKQTNRAQLATQEFELARGEKGARLYVMRKAEGQSIDQIASARSDGGKGSAAMAQGGVRKEVDKPDARRTSKTSGFGFNLCLGLGTCGITRLTMNSGSAVDKNGLVGQGGNSVDVRDVGTNRVEVGGAPHPYSGNGFLFSP